MLETMPWLPAAEVDIALAMIISRTGGNAFPKTWSVAVTESQRGVPSLMEVVAQSQAPVYSGCEQSLPTPPYCGVISKMHEYWRWPLFVVHSRPLIVSHSS